MLITSKLNISNLVSIQRDTFIANHACETLNNACKSGALLRKIAIRAPWGRGRIMNMNSYIATCVSPSKVLDVSQGSVTC